MPPLKGKMTHTTLNSSRTSEFPGIRGSFQPHILREVVIHGACALELPAHLSLARPLASENVTEKREQHPPGFFRLFCAVAPRHGVVQPATADLPARASASARCTSF